MIRILINFIALLVVTVTFSHSCPLSDGIDTELYLKESSKFSILRRSVGLAVENEIINENYLLGDETVPSYYKLTLFVNESSNGRFYGNVEITFQAKVAVDTVWLTAEGISFEGNLIKVYKTDDDKNNLFESINSSLSDPYQKYGFKLSTKLTVNQDYVIKIQYPGTLYEHTDMRGLYKSYYEEKGSNKTLFTTHFGQQARRLMPCWDENRFKAQFEFIVHRDPNAHPISVSNAQIRETKDNTDYYKPTSVIAPYILALIISDFQVARDDKFGVYARPEAIDQAKFALGIGPKLLKAFNEWTSINYYNVPGAEKMDMAAIPDFSAGAMENWGLMTYREVNSLYDERYTTSIQKQRTALVISHELSHMWFGDLVTCDHFSETWLNEGFARYFQFIGLDKVDKSYQGLYQFPVTVVQKVFETDATSNTHPLTNPGMNSYSDIRTMFSSISYDKGASILRMIHNIMGDEKFQTGIRQYLLKNQHKTAIPEDLFVELEKQYNGITEILGPYTVQSGVPLVTATKKDDKIILTQKRFLSAGIEHNDTTKWNIPITVAINKEDFENSLSHLTIFEGLKNDELTIDIKNATLNYYLLNIQQYGYYRVNYDTENWISIGRALKSENFGNIHVINRAQIIDDLFNLAKVGYVKYDLVFDITSYVKNDQEHLPWLATYNGLSYLAQRISNEDQELKKLFDSFINNLLVHIYDHVGFEDKGDHLLKLTRINVLKWSCKYGNEKCLENALKLFDNKNRTLIAPDLKPATYCTGLRHRNASWNEMWNSYLEHVNFATEQITILQALGCSSRSEDINNFMDKILTDDIRPQDKSTAFTSAYTGNQENVDTALKYIMDNDKKWMEKMSLVSTLTSLAGRFTREEQFDTLEDYAKKHEAETKDQLLKMSQEKRKQLEWDKTRLAELKGFLKSSGIANCFNTILSSILLLVVYLFK